MKSYTHISAAFGILLLAMAFCACPTRKLAEAENKSVTKGEAVSITVTQTQSYCGGARPPEELLAELATPQPLPDKKLHIKKGEWNDVNAAVLLSINSNQHGQLRMTLEPGTYCIVMDNKVDSAYYKMLLLKYATATSNYEAINKVCLDEWLRTPEISFEVKHGAPNTFSLNMHQPCTWNSVPCAQYTGPYPP